VYVYVLYCCSAAGVIHSTETCSSSMTCAHLVMPRLMMMTYDDRVPPRRAPTQKQARSFHSKK